MRGWRADLLVLRAWVIRRHAEIVLVLKLPSPTGLTLDHAKSKPNKCCQLTNANLLNGPRWPGGHSPAVCGWVQHQVWKEPGMSWGSPARHPPPSHLLDRISPIFPPFSPVFCAFSPSRRGGSNEPQAGTQGQETAGKSTKRGGLPPSFGGCFSHTDGAALQSHCRRRSAPTEASSTRRARTMASPASVSTRFLLARFSRQLSGTCADTAGGSAAQMLAVNATDGSLVSSFQSETKPSLTSPPDEFAAPRLSADGGAVFVGCANSHLYALNATNLAVLWVANTSGDECTSPTQLLMVVASLTRKRHRRRREPGGDAEPEHRR